MGDGLGVGETTIDGRNRSRRLRLGFVAMLCAGFAAAAAPGPATAQSLTSAGPTSLRAAADQVDATGTASRTRSEIRAQWRTEMLPVGSAAGIGAILKAGGATLPVRSLIPGRAEVDWYNVPPGARSGGHAAAQARTLLLATGTVSFPAAGSGRLTMRLTPDGRDLLEAEAASHVAVLRVSARATFTPIGGARPIDASSTQAPAPAGATPRCFGAASHDPLEPCRNPSLSLDVRPTPDEALITPNAPCTPSGADALLIPCVFGAPLSPTTPEIALVGDSHAEMWRGAMTVVADRLHASGVSLTRSSCAYSHATPMLAVALASGCVAWRDGVVAWLRANPRVATVFVSDNDLGGVVPPPGATVFAAEVDGYLNAWRALPPSVRHIVVLRDIPVPDLSTGRCVGQAITQHEPAGAACGLPRSSALQPDAEATAAYDDEPRATVIDMTGFFCGLTLCPPVIGGVLVYKDGSHMTNLYSTTLGPFLLARVRRLETGWSGA